MSFSKSAFHFFHNILYIIFVVENVVDDQPIVWGSSLSFANFYFYHLFGGIIHLSKLNHLQSRVGKRFASKYPTHSRHGWGRSWSPFRTICVTSNIVENSHHSIYKFVSSWCSVFFALTLVTCPQVKKSNVWRL